MKSTPPASLVRWSGLSLLLGGVFNVLFVLVHPQGKFTPAVMASRIAEVAHTFHFVGASLAAFGLLGLLLRMSEAGRRAGTLGTVLAFFGTVWFAGLGLLSFAALPFIARHDPALVEPNGAFWSDPPSPAFLLGLACFVVGYVVLGIVVLRGVGMPRWSGLLLVLGALLTSLPPVAVPTVLILTVGGILLGAGWVWLGYSLCSQKGVASPPPDAGGPADVLAGNG